MKKTFTVNIGQSIFNIDEDAYDILKKYLISVKKYFNTIDDQGEIIIDFELRIAENFSSKISVNKNIIDLDDVRKMIKIMGTLDDFKEAYGNETNQEKQNNDTYEDRKLYRDSSNRIIAGVGAGIAQYFKIDPIIVRIVLILASLGGLGLIAYIICWIGVPTKDFDVNLRKTFYRDPEENIIGGVAKGMANYLNLDVTLIRVFFFISIFFGGFGLLLYIFLWIFTKEASSIGQKMNMSGYNINLSNIEDFIKKNTAKKNGKESTLTKIFLFPFRLIAPLINTLAKMLIILFRLILFIIITFIAALCFMFLIIILVNLFNLSNNLDIASYHLISVCIGLLLTIGISIIIAAKIMFKRTIVNPYVFAILFFLWLTFLLLNLFSFPDLLINLQEQGFLYDWIVITKNSTGILIDID
ncbi:MAG TPA: PspC domain-containing protein [Flavobacteriaceae bacterium]|nr:PspC domain-containing protein [Flavobacteriaceae bacterium]|tara:strand:- start:1725 stop:2963 length:1239 start_codon:yes stop_codon:yes gene_type:complete